MPRSAGVRPSAARPARPCCTIGGGTGQGSQTPPPHLAADPPHQRRCASLRDALIAILSQTAGYAGAAPTHIQSRHPMRRWARPGGLTKDRLPRAPHRPRRPMVTRYAIIGLGRKASRSVLLPLLLPAALRVQQTAHHITNMVRFVKRKCEPASAPQPPGRPLRGIHHHRIGIAQQRGNRCRQCGIAAVPGGIEAIADKAVAADPLDRGT